jgi:curved DNA-binding protein CbpA
MAAEANERVDLTEEEQKRILCFFATLETLTHHELLQVSREADEQEIKRAYFRVSRDFHPDRYFRRELGPFKDKVEAIFKKLNKAYEVLSDPKRRKQYESTLPEEITPERIAAKLEASRREKAAEETKAQDQKLAEERRQRLLRHHPIAKRRAIAEQHFADALCNKDTDPVKASNCLQLALAHDPNNPTYLKLQEDLSPASRAVRFERAFGRAQSAESVASYEEALDGYLLALDMDPNEPRALIRAINLLVTRRKDRSRAMTLAHRLEEGQPKNLQALRFLARAYRELGMFKNAIRVLSRYLEQNGEDKDAAKELKELKKLG